MALASELMELGAMAHAPAKAIGCAGTNLSVTAAGNNSQSAAAANPQGFNIVATSGGSTNSLILPAADAKSLQILQVASAQTTVNLFPASGQTIVDEGAQGGANAAVTLAASKAAMIWPCGNTWFVIRGA